MCVKQKNIWVFLLILGCYWKNPTIIILWLNESYFIFCYFKYLISLFNWYIGNRLSVFVIKSFPFVLQVCCNIKRTIWTWHVTQTILSNQILKNSYGIMCFRRPWAEFLGIYKKEKFLSFNNTWRKWDFDLV